MNVYKTWLSIGGGEREGQKMMVSRPIVIGERFGQDGHTWEITGMDETPFVDHTGAYSGVVWARRVEENAG